MGRQQRIEKMERELCALEATFTARLSNALQIAASGQWGIFGAYLQLANFEWANEAYNDLNALGDEIEALRAKLGMGEFDVFSKYKSYCRRHGPNDPGEPRLAQELLNQLSEGASTEKC